MAAIEHEIVERVAQFGPDFKIRSMSNDSETVTLKASSPWKDSAEQEEGLPVEIFERITEWLR
ncbi:hypothetical protein [Bradyrhizobium symbiodeficiens]|uniref:hypothetical protein n=1 Tax=Bradyrhizobium symbiodeficiens TaxID=1404367 RepID=UPI000BA1BB8C|nr:hypothetical protein [Bradyrhizobium symbiodeficiens]AWM05860.1 hypothetical protein CIT39_04930 [Bradyrhizobium symbiodeficiens]